MSGRSAIRVGLQLIELMMDFTKRCPFYVDIGFLTLGLSPEITAHGGLGLIK